MSIRIITGHVLEVLRGVAAESVHTVVTSPPYYGLRDYGIEPQVWGEAGCEHEWIEHERGLNNRHAVALARGDEGTEKGGTANHRDFRLKTDFCLRCGAWRGSLGLEPTLGLYLDHMTEVMRAVRRVLRKDGTVWMNVGDSYCGSPPGNKPGWSTSGLHGAATSAKYQETLGRSVQTVAGKLNSGLKPKDLMLVPARLAIRLQEDGWWVRSDIIWAKRAPMPESVTDRPTSAHEHVLLLSKSAKYFYDAEAVKEDFADERNGNPGVYSKTSARSKGATQDRQDLGFLNKGGGWNADGAASGRNLRNVWLLGPEPFPEAHFATYPTEIPRRAILAGTSAKGVCAKCGAPWERVTATEKTRPGVTGGATPYDSKRPDGMTLRAGGFGGGSSETLGWRPTCGCDAGDPIPATCLDPFLGSGTTALVADRLGRDCIGIELNEAYAAMARKRISSDAGMFAELAAE
jgi:DNA modification methylase